MPKNFKELAGASIGSLGRAGVLGKDPKLAGRIIVGVLLLANLVVFSIAMGWWGGSPEDLEQELTSLRQQVVQRKNALLKAKQVAAKVDLGRAEGDKFLSGYFLARRSAYSTVVSDLVAMAKTAQVTPREIAYVTDPIDGSDTLSMMSITANYEGTYADVMRFIAQVDRSQRLLIIETLNAAPQQGGNRLNVAMKINTFVREDGGALPPVPGMPAESADAPATAGPRAAAASTAPADRSGQ
ncbi:MAG: hypothetical protein ABI823_15190 [Bryobacteraceae bacterium]